MTTAVRQEIYHRKLKLFQQASLASFDRFLQLPFEIRLMIWEFSLPGPRTLTVSDDLRKPDKLHFRENENYPNPVALSICRESRAFALERYRLCFGTPNVYADLPRGDILYFGPSWNQVNGHLLGFYDDGFFREHRNRAYAKLATSVRADLQQVTHLAISPRTWSCYTPSRQYNPCAFDLRHGVKVFCKLKQLLLVTESCHNPTPGYVSFKDRPPQNIEYMQREFLKDFREKDLDDQEMELGVPDIRFVDAQWATHIPGDDWERNEGEPFYLPERNLKSLTEPHRSARRSGSEIS